MSRVGDRVEWVLYGSRGILQIAIRLFTSFEISTKLLQNCDNMLSNRV